MDYVDQSVKFLNNSSTVFLELFYYLVFTDFAIWAININYSGLLFWSNML